MIDVQRIIDELEEQRAAIDAAIASLRQISGISSIAKAAVKRVAARKRTGAGGRRHISEEGRLRIAEAQRRRWAAQKGESSSAASGRPGRKKRGRKPGSKRAKSESSGGTAAQ